MNAKRWVVSAFAWVNGAGMTVAKKNGMLTISAFIIAVSSVFGSVLWACKAETIA